MKLTNQDLDILRELLHQKLKELNGQDDNSAVYINLIKKLDSLYFS